MIDLKTGTILIVDDLQKNIQLVGTTLAGFGYDFMVANSGKQAIERVKARIPDLVLMDLVMPDLDGFEVCRAFQKIDGMENVPIIFLSAQDEKNTIVRALEVGGVDYVTKPFNKAELLARVRTHLELKLMRDELKEESRRREAFVEVVAHDLKNWLGSANFSGRLLHQPEKFDADRLRRLGESITESTDRALEFIQNYLEDVRSTRVEIEVSCTPTELGQICRDVATEFTRNAQEKGIRIGLNLPDNPVVGKVDALAMRRILQNLLSNALKFSPPDTEVQIILQEDPCQILIQDQGPGFSEEDREEMFKPFSRLSAQPTNGEVSTGLGLSIVKKLAEGMSLKLEIGYPEEGAVIHVLFPT